MTAGAQPIEAAKIEGWFDGFGNYWQRTTDGVIAGPGSPRKFLIGRRPG